MGLVLSLIFLSLSAPAATDPAGLIYPQHRWDKRFDAAEDVAYGVAVTPDGGAVVVGTSGVIKYDVNGNLVWKAGYPGTAYAAVADGEGNVFVAGEGGLAKFGPDGGLSWLKKGGFRDLALTPAGLIVALGDGYVIAYDPRGGSRWRMVCPGEPRVMAVADSGLIVGGPNGATVLSRDPGGRAWSAPALGELREVTVDPKGNIFLVGAQGIRAYSPQGALLWEREFPGEALAGTVYAGPEGPWLVVVGIDPGRRGLVFVGYSLEEGQPNWKVVKYKPGEVIRVHDVAADVKAGVLYVVGAEMKETGQDPDYLTSQYILAAPKKEGASSEGCAVTADFSYSPENPLSGEKITFANGSSGEAVSWVWDFGDGVTSRDRDPVHVYPAPGTYTVTLTVSDALGCIDTAQKVVEVENRPPEIAAVEYGIAPRAAFSWDVERGVYGDYPTGFFPEGITDLDNVLFSDGSGPGPVTLRAEAHDPDGAVVAYEWDLDFDGVVDAEGAEVTWDFGEPGVYPITLVAVDDRGAEARYEGFVDTQGYEIVAWEWDFGDGEVSGERNPVHRFRDDGAYEVVLTVWDDAGNSASVAEEILIQNVPPAAAFTYEVQPGGGELSADFTWSVDPERHGTYPEGFSPPGPTDLDDILFEDNSTVIGGPGVAIFTAEAVDPDGEVVRYEWDFDGDGEIDAEGEVVEWVPPGSGTYNVRLIVTDDDGDSTTYTQEVELEAGGGEIVEREWDFGDGATSDERNPIHWFQDDGVYDVTLTVWDSLGNSDSVTKGVAIGNVPPVADFDWDFEQPEGFLPACEGLLGAGGGEGGGVACREPEMPPDAGVVAFRDLSYDSEPWLDIAEWAWQWDLGGYAECWEGGDCSTAQDPLVLFLWDTDHGPFLYRGDLDATLRVRDEDGEGGGDYPFSSITRTVTIGNIPPYAAFEWGTDPWSWTELACDGCAGTYGSGDPENQASNGQITVTRRIYSWDCGFGEEPSAIIAPWGGAGVELVIEGTGTVEVTEAIPEGWSYWLGWLDECVTVLEEGQGHFSLAVDLDACGGLVSIWYDLYPPDPWAGAPADPGLYLISGTLTAGTPGITLDSTIVVCALVDVESTVYFHGYGWDELWMADPNGDEISSWEWDFGGFGAASGQDPEGGPCSAGTCAFVFTNVASYYDAEAGTWIWSYDLPVSLAVTDSAGDTTVLDAVLHLEGSAGGAYLARVMDITVPIGCAP